MPARSLKQIDIENSVARINRIYSFDALVGIDWIQGKPRLGICTRTKNNIDRYISPRLTRSQFVMWLDGFEEGLNIRGK